MSSRLRFFIFLTFLLTFLISAPLVVLYTAGYRFDFAHGRIVQTAVLQVTSTPRNADVLIDGELAEDRTPATIERVLPGEHVVRVEKEGYLSWEKTLSFESRQTTFASGVVLLKEADAELVDELVYEDAAVSLSGDVLAYTTQESSWIELWTTDGSGEATQLVSREPYDLARDYRIGFDEDVPVLLAEDESVVVLEDFVVSRAGDRTAVSRVDDQGVASILTYIPLSTYVIEPAPEGLVMLRDVVRGRLVLIDPADRQQPILLNEEAVLWDWDAQGNRLLFSTGFDLFVYDKGAHQTQTLTRTSELIEQVLWYPEVDLVLYAQSGSVNARELDDRDVVNAFVLAQLDGPFWVSADGQWLYWVFEGSVWRRNL